MGLSYLLKGIVLGFSIAAPVGPISLLCIRRTAAEGWVAGFISGLGVASADAVYGGIAAFGLTAVSTLLISQRQWIQAIGGIFLLYLGIKIFWAKPVPENASTEAKTSLVKAYASIFFLTLTNPMTILSFVGVFAGLGITGGNLLESAQTVAGVFLGSALWWLVLSGAVGLVRGRLNAKALSWINLGSGLVIVIFGLLAMFKASGINL